MPAQARILIEVPALERFVRARSEPYGEFSLEHIQYFSRQSLVRLMSALGYQPLAISIVALDDAGACDSLFGLFARSKCHGEIVAAEAKNSMIEYLARSRRDMERMLRTLMKTAPPTFAIYGAGSHSARLLPALSERGLLDRVNLIADGNPNLQGKLLSRFSILPPQALDDDPSLPVLISSHRAQAAIAAALQGRQPRRPLLKLYPVDAR